MPANSPFPSSRAIWAARNTIKRQVYSVSEAAKLSPAAYLVRLRAGFDRVQFPCATSVALKRAVRGEIIQLFQRAHA